MIIIPVSDVTMPTQLLPTAPASAIMQLKCKMPMEFGPSSQASWVKIQEWQSKTHVMLLAAELAFQDHRPLAISPDMIWLLIAQGVGTHVTLHAEELRKQFVPFEGKDKIVVNRDEFVKGSPENDWEGVVQEFTGELEKRSHGHWRDTLVPTFSTTDAKETLAFQVAYMAAMANYFDYEVMTMCGIPAIHLGGSPADWQMIIDRVTKLNAIGLDWWVSRILPLLEAILASAEGRADRAFWKSIYKLDDMSGGPYITGWLRLFFPYLEEQVWGDRQPEDATTAGLWERAKQAFGFGQKGSAKERARLRRNPAVVTNREIMTELSNFPPGICKAPFVWKYLGQSLDMAFLSGFVGIHQDPTSLLLTPQIDWAVVEGQG